MAASTKTTVNLEDELLLRVRRAMRARGATVYNDFARLALINLCRETEEDLRKRAPAEYVKIYGND